MIRYISAWRAATTLRCSSLSALAFERSGRVSIPPLLPQRLNVYTAASATSTPLQNQRLGTNILPSNCKVTPGGQENAGRGFAATSSSSMDKPKGAHHTELHSATGVLTFRSSDQLGIVSAIAKIIASRGGNLISLDLHIDHMDQANPEFFCRTTFSYDPTTWQPATMHADFGQLSTLFRSKHMSVYVPGITPQKRIGILVSKQDHCLMDILYRWEAGQLDCRIDFVVSNHEQPAGSHVRELLAKLCVPFIYLPTLPDDQPTDTKLRRQEQQLLEIAQDTDMLVLARYMQVMSAPFLRAYNRDIINIHHGLLPSFKGANPYRQAFDAGVKLIGATSHFVTKDLDEGPIIEQLVDRVSHRDQLYEFAAKSQNLEKQCLFNALSYYLDNRLLRYGMNRRVMVLN